MKRLVLGVAAATVLMAQQRFDLKVREDFFVGFAGNRAALDRGMKNCEEALTGDPKNAEALVWHGARLFFLSGQSFQKGDTDKGIALYSRGIKEMDEAVSLAPDSVGVLIPRGAGFLFPRLMLTSKSCTPSKLGTQPGLVSNDARTGIFEPCNPRSGTRNARCEPRMQR